MSSKRRFLLMNKDIVVLIFSTVLEEFALNYKVEYIEKKFLVPRGLRNLREWIEERYICIFQNGIHNFYELTGISGIEELIEITNCISLKDTYWVKKDNSRKTWNSVSPYRNSLNEIVTEYSFTGKLMGKITTGSPDFSTDGNFTKCWKREYSGLYLYKAGSSGACNAGNEPYSEVYAYKIAAGLGIEIVKYELSSYAGRLISKCKCLTNENVGLVPYRELYGTNRCNFAELLHSVDSTSKKQILDMLLLDYITCNTDRHYGNIGIFIENDTNRILGFAPLYDHNLSCLPYYMEDENLEFYISDIRAKDGRTWEELYKLLECDYTKEKLGRLLGVSFGIGEKRDDIINRMVEHQVKKALAGS